MRARTRGGRWTRWTALHDAGDHGPDAGRGSAGTDPAWTGAADEFQLRLKGRRARPARALRALRPRGARRAPQPPARARVGARGGRPARPAIIPRSAWGGDTRPAAQRPVLRPGPARVRAPHGQRERVRAGGLGGDRARDRALPPRPQRLERRRLQLPRRPVRPDLRGPRRRHRPRDRRRAGAGLQQRLDRRRAASARSRRVAPPPAGDRRDRARDRLEALAPRRPGRRARSPSRRRAARPTASRPARRSRSSASRATATATPRRARATSLYGQLADLRARAAQYAGPLAGRDVRAASTKLRGVTIGAR